MSTAFRFNRPTDLTLVANPTLSVAVVIATRGGQDNLDLVLAGLAQQSYPEKLINVYIIDDGSEVAITLPSIRPANTKILTYKNSNNHWGKTAATNDVVAKLKEEIFWFIDADMIFEPDHLAHHMKWHHESDDYVVLGWKRFVDKWNYTPKELSIALKEKNFDSLHSESWVKDLWESRIKYTNELINPGLDGYRSLVGATFSIANKQWKLLGGYDRFMRTGEDTELGWRVFNSGLRMVPDRAARSWHLGFSSIEIHKAAIQRHNDPMFAQRIPDRRSIRAQYSLDYSVPTYEVLIDARNASLKQIFKIQENLLQLQGTSMKVRLLGPWHQLHDRYKVIDDNDSDLREIWNWLNGDHRFEFEDIAPDLNLTIDSLVGRFIHSATPYYLFIEGDLDADLNDLVDYLVTKEEGFVGVVDAKDKRAFAVYGPALARAHRTGGWIYQLIAEQWGVQWLTHENFINTYRDKHNRVKRLLRFLKREIKKIRSFSQLKIFIKKLIRIILRKVLHRG